jgi:hypothetical protein
MRKTDEIEQPASCLNNSQPDEPLFVLCARDPIAARIVRGWAERYAESKGGREKLTARQAAKYTEAHALADAMDAWAREQGLIDECGRPLPKN